MDTPPHVTHVIDWLKQELPKAGPGSWEIYQSANENAPFILVGPFKGTITDDINTTLYGVLNDLYAAND